MPQLSADLAFRGLIHQVTDRAVLERLDAGGLTAYIGFDPSAPSLHVGNLLQLCTLRRLQLGGHRPIALAGGGTGMIGDPGGKTGERPLQSAGELAENLAGIGPQLGQFLDFSPDRATGALLVDNGAWLGNLGLIEFLRDVGKHFTVNQMVAKESVRSRFERPDQGISYTEFSYMLLQAYDFLRLHDDHGCLLQLGGSDQWGNITMGVDLIRRVRRVEAFGLTTPLVTKADGTKFGKTETGTVWLDPARTSPYRLFQFFLNTEDSEVGAYLRYFTFLGHEEIRALDEATAARPQERAAPRALARAVCALVHGPGEAERAERAAGALFHGDVAALDERTLLEVLDDAPATSVSRAALAGGLPLVEVLVDTGLAGSRRQARQLLAEKGISVNGRVEHDEGRRLGPADLLHDRSVVLRRGKRSYQLLRVE